LIYGLITGPVLLWLLRERLTETTPPPATA
jgi:hypothetical protein